MIDCMEYFEEFTDYHKYRLLCDVCNDECVKYNISEQEFEMIVQKCLKLANKQCGIHASKIAWFLYCYDYTILYINKELAWYKSFRNNVDTM